MKKFIAAALAAFLIIGFISCAQDSEDSTNNNSNLEENDTPSTSEDTVTPGWYFYTYEGSLYEYFIYINAQGYIERVGEEYREYNENVLKNWKEIFSYFEFQKMLKDEENFPNMKFELTEPPEWANPRRDCRINITYATYTATVNQTNYINVGLFNCLSSDTIELVIETTSGIEKSEDVCYFDRNNERIQLYSTHSGMITFKLVNKTANIESNTCCVTFVDNSSTNNSGTNTTPSDLILGTWYCSNAGLFSYFEFYSNGTGKTYASSPSNYSSFSWTLSGELLKLTGNVYGRIEVSVTETKLIFYDCELFTNNPTLRYTKQ